VDFGPLEVTTERAMLVIRMIGRRFKRTLKLSGFLKFLCCQTGAAVSEAKSSGIFVEPREFAANVVFFRESGGGCENLTRNRFPGGWLRKTLGSFNSGNFSEADVTGFPGRGRTRLECDKGIPAVSGESVSTGSARTANRVRIRVSFREPDSTQ
jgi:hypothetical protein